MGQTITAEELLDFLQHVEGFKEIPAEDLEAFIIPLISIATYEAGQYIINRGTAGSQLFILYEGLARIDLPQEKNPSGKALHFTLGKGDVVGEMSLVSNQPARADVVAEKQSILLTLDIETFQSLMINLWGVTKAFAGLIGKRLANRD